MIDGFTTPAEVTGKVISLEFTVNMISFDEIELGKITVMVSPVLLQIPSETEIE